jgi:gliding motility-associated-like protein
LICKNIPIQLFASGGTTYTWSPPATLNDPSISNPVATTSASTKYYVTVTDANTCTNIDSVMVNVRPDPVFTVSPSTNVCENNSTQLTATGGDVYSWQPAASLSDPTISNPIATPMSTTDYSVLITETACNNSTTLTTTVTVLPPPSVHASKSNDLDCSNDASQLNATGAIIYTWSPAVTLDNPNIQNPIATPTTTTQYSVKGVDASGCSNIDTITVYVTGLNKGGYLMPNAFTPNNDGKNDCYGVKYWGVILELDFSIYNRWGQRIFHTNQPGQCWDGTFNGQPQNPDVYIYMIKAKTFCDQYIFRKGTFTLIR